MVRDYNQLLAAYKVLEEENAKLKAENQRLRDQGTILIPGTPMLSGNDSMRCSQADEPKAVSSDNQILLIDNHSTPDEKVQFFMSHFHGRDDVYAKRWQASNGKSGYQPACENEWIEGICDKRKYKCNSCPSRKLSPLNKVVIESHLRGADKLCRDVIGIYPLLLNETCFFLAVDFDGEGWQEDIPFMYPTDVTAKAGRSSAPSPKSAGKCWMAMCSLSLSTSYSTMH
jgi:hypothetical protein